MTGEQQRDQAAAVAAYLAGDKMALALAPSDEAAGVLALMVETVPAQALRPASLRERPWFVAQYAVGREMLNKLRGDGMAYVWRDQVPEYIGDSERRLAREVAAVKYGYRVPALLEQLGLAIYIAPAAEPVDRRA